MLSLKKKNVVKSLFVYNYNIELVFLYLVFISLSCEFVGKKLTFPTYQIHSNSNVYNLCRIAALEAELEEEQTQSEMLMERARKSQTSVEQLTAELATERGMQCSGSMTFWCGSGSGSADPCLCLMDPDPAIFVSDLQDIKKNNFF